MLPLVLKSRPTGYISEIANFVPACGKCNQSKGNKPWRQWMLSETGRHSPTVRRIANLAVRIARLEQFEQMAHAHKDRLREHTRTEGMVRLLGDVDRPERGDAKVPGRGEQASGSYPEIDSESYLTTLNGR